MAALFRRRASSGARPAPAGRASVARARDVIAEANAGLFKGFKTIFRARPHACMAARDDNLAAHSACGAKPPCALLARLAGPRAPDACAPLPLRSDTPRLDWAVRRRAVTCAGAKRRPPLKRFCMRTPFGRQCRRRACWSHGWLRMVVATTALVWNLHNRPAGRRPQPIDQRTATAFQTGAYACLYCGAVAPGDQQAGFVLGGWLKGSGCGGGGGRMFPFTLSPAAASTGPRPSPTK